MTTLSEFSRPYLLIVEGPGDVAFFRHLIATRSLPNEFDVCCPANASGVDQSGNSRFKEALDGFAATPGFDDLKGIFIVTDNDENPSESIRLVRNQISDTLRKFHAPAKALVKSNGNPPIVIVPIPWEGVVGNLETLCVEAAETAFPSLARCADDFQTCSGVSAWPPSKRSKVKIRSIISAVHRRNADLGLAYLWKARPDIIPLDHPCFNRIVSLLADPKSFFA